MIIINGKEVPETLTEVVNPKHTALLVVDLQNDFCSLGGVFHKAGADLSMYPQVLNHVGQLINSARNANIKIIFIQNTNQPGNYTESPAQIRFNIRVNKAYSKENLKPLEYTLVGTWGHQVVDTLIAQPSDIFVTKHRSSAFVGTSLDLILRSNMIRTVVIVGCTTEGCVDSTARDAGFLDYFVVIPRDCVGSDNSVLHHAAMLIMESYRMEMSESEELDSIWKQSLDNELLLLHPIPWK